MLTNKTKLSYEITLSRHFITAKNAMGKPAEKSGFVFLGGDTYEIAVICIFCQPGSGDTQHVIFASSDNKAAQKTRVVGFGNNSKKQTVVTCETELFVPKDLVENSILVFVPALVMKNGNRLAYYAPDCEITNTNYEKISSFSGEPKYSESGELETHKVTHLGSGTTEQLALFSGITDNNAVAIPDNVKFEEIENREKHENDLTWQEIDRVEALFGRLYDGLVNAGLQPTPESKRHGSARLFAEDKSFFVDICTGGLRISCDLFLKEYGGNSPTVSYVKNEEDAEDFISVITAMLKNPKDTGPLAEETEEDFDEEAEEEEIPEEIEPGEMPDFQEDY